MDEYVAALGEVAAEVYDVSDETSLIMSRALRDLERGTPEAVALNAYLGDVERIASANERIAARIRTIAPPPTPALLIHERLLDYADDLAYMAPLLRNGFAGDGAALSRATRAMVDLELPSIEGLAERCVYLERSQ